jgi:hypothetical protein
MEFETPKARKVKEDLDRMFGDRQSAKDMRQAIFMARNGLVNDEAIAAYVRYKEKEREEYLEVMTEANPDYAFKVGDELLSLDNSKKNAIEFSSSPASTDSGDHQHGGDQDVVSQH